MTIPWSYSYLINFEKCPKMVYFQKVKKIDDGLDNVQHIIDGKEMHVELENWLNARIRGESYEYPERADKIRDAIDKIVDAAGIENCKAEKRYAFSKDFESEVDFFKGPNVWMRAVVDLEAEKDKTAYVVDYKSGKYNPYASFANMGQLQLYAIIKLITAPHIEEVQTSLFYAKDGKIITRIYRRNKLAYLLKMFISRGNSMYFAEEFPARPSKSNCKWCNYKEEHCDFAHQE